MNLIKPKKLIHGGTIAIIAPSGAVDIQKINNAKKYFEKLGYKVKLGANIEKTLNYLAGRDEDRLFDLHSAFQDKEINAILCARGGYGALRLIDKIDYNLIRNNPKIFAGYSDITILNSLFLKKCSLVTFSAPMAQSDFSSESINEFTEHEFFKNLEADRIEIYAKNQKYYSNQRTAKGILFGGNLSTLASLCGTDFIPDDKFIFFAEDIGEPAYKIDRYFTQLLNIPQFKSNICAILLGDFLDIDDEKYFDSFFVELSQKLNIPIVKRFPFSHTGIKSTVPVGAFANLQDNILTVTDYLDE